MQGKSTGNWYKCRPDARFYGYQCDTISPLKGLAGGQQPQEEANQREQCNIRKRSDAISANVVRYIRLRAEMGKENPSDYPDTQRYRRLLKGRKCTGSGSCEFNGHVFESDRQQRRQYRAAAGAVGEKNRVQPLAIHFRAVQDNDVHSQRNNHDEYTGL